MQYVLEFREPLGAIVREHTPARRRRRGEERRGHMRDDLHNLGEAVRLVLRELFGR